MGHNGKRFDFLFLINELARNGLLNLLHVYQLTYAIDTQLLAKKTVSTKNLAIPCSYKLVDLFEYVSQTKMDGAHRALADVKATSTVLRHKAFWEERKEHVFVFNQSSQMGRQLNDDSDTDYDSEGGLDDEVDQMETTREVDNEMESDTARRTGWVLGEPFHGLDTVHLFQQHFSKKITRGTDVNTSRTGLQCSPNSVNSPAKAWREIFTHSILDKIVAYTNEYGEIKAKDWTDITRQDLMDFISVLFIGKFESDNMVSKSMY